MNTFIVLCTIICYSPGFLNLRPNDPSIFKAGLAIIAGIGLVCLFYVANKSLLTTKECQLLKSTENIDVDAVVSNLSKYQNDKYLSKVAKTALDQLRRLNNASMQANTEITRKFGDSGMTFEKYKAGVDTAIETALENIVKVSERLQLYDSNEYAKLKSQYKLDDIPNDIQEKQLRLFEKNKDLALKAINANENLILSINTLIFELNSADTGDDSDALLAEMQSLSDEVKYYI